MTEALFGATQATPPSRRSVVASIGAVAIGGCASVARDGETARITVVARVPKGVGPVYLTGNLAELGPWNPAALAMGGAGEERTAIVRAPIGTVFEFKVTLGSWDREGLGPSGTVMPNTQVTVTGDQIATIAVGDFKKDPLVYLNDPRGSGVIGRLVNWLDVGGAGLAQKRHVQVWLPPGYDENPARRYRVIYMHDGQNLFDPRIANTGTDWGVDETIVRLSGAGMADPAIVVAVWSTSQRRLEYAPSKVLAALPSAVQAELVTEFGGQPLGDRYIAFLADELKPRIDQTFRTLTGPESTSLMGSSMGGLISFYSAVERPDVFGAAACLSMHWPVAITAQRIFERADEWRPLLLKAYIAYLGGATLSPLRTRIWADHGGGDLDSLYGPYQQAIAPVLTARGFETGPRLQLRAFANSEHNEASWRARLDEPMRFLLSRET